MGQCHPLPGAQVDIWHCDARGVYLQTCRMPASLRSDKSFCAGTRFRIRKEKARFLTIYPGWYPGRTVHIHLKVRTATETKPSFELTTQMYFDDALSDRVFADPPYAEQGSRAGRNQDDRIFRRGGEQLLLSPMPAAEGFSATFSPGPAGCPRPEVAPAWRSQQWIRSRSSSSEAALAD